MLRDKTARKLAEEARERLDYFSKRVARLEERAGFLSGAHAPGTTFRMEGVTHSAGATTVFPLFGESPLQTALNALRSENVKRALAARPATINEVLDYVLEHGLTPWLDNAILTCGCRLPSFDFCPEEKKRLRWVVRWLTSHHDNCSRRPRPVEDGSAFPVGARVRVGGNGRMPWYGSVIARPANCRVYGVQGEAAGPLVWLVNDHGRVYGIYPANVRRVR